MESEVKKRKAQLYKYQGIGFGICILGIIYLCCMISGIDTYYVEWAFGRGVSFLLSFSIILVYALFVAAGCIVARRGGVRISEILSEECDPFLYEACISGRGRLFYRERVLCNLALARYYQGNYDKAWETLKGIDPHKLRGIFKANFYILLSDLYFKRGMGMGVRGIEEEFRQSMKGKREQRYFEMLCAGNNLTRALENQDYLSGAWRKGECAALPRLCCCKGRSYAVRAGGRADTCRHGKRVKPLVKFLIETAVFGIRFQIKLL